MIIYVSEEIAIARLPACHPKPIGMINNDS